MASNVTMYESIPISLTILTGFRDQHFPVHVYGVTKYADERAYPYEC